MRYFEAIFIGQYVSDTRGAYDQIPPDVQAEIEQDQDHISGGNGMLIDQHEVSMPDPEEPVRTEWIRVYTSTEADTWVDGMNYGTLKLELTVPAACEFADEAWNRALSDDSLYRAICRRYPDAEIGVGPA